VYDVFLVGGTDLAHLRHHGLARVGELQLVVATVLDTPLPRDEALLLQNVDQRDDPTGNDTQLSRQGLLTQAWIDGDQAQDPDIPGLEVEVGKPLGEPGRREGPDLRQQEADPLRRPSVSPSSRIAVTHAE
jgi:hypothetical protein